MMTERTQIRVCGLGRWAGFGGWVPDSSGMGPNGRSRRRSGSMVRFGTPIGWATAIGMVAAVSSAMPETHHDPKTPVTMRLLVANTAAPAGSTVDALLVFDIEPKWHIYYDGENDTGQPPIVTDAKLPEGIKLGAIRWATPNRQVLGGDILDSMYERHVELPITIEISDKAKAGETTGTFDVRWMECSSQCRMNNANATLNLRVLAKGEKAVESQDAKAVAAAIAALPKRWTPELAKSMKDQLTIAVEKGRLVVKAGKAKAIEYHARAGSVKLAEPIKEGKADGGELSAVLAVGDKEKSDPKAAVRGIVVVIDDKGGRTGYEIDMGLAGTGTK